MQDQAVQRLKRGDVVDIMIKSIVPYGAFGNIVDPQTKHVTGGSVRFLGQTATDEHVLLANRMHECMREHHSKFSAVLPNLLKLDIDQCTAAL